MKTLIATCVCGYAFALLAVFHYFSSEREVNTLPASSLALVSETRMPEQQALKLVVARANCVVQGNFPASVIEGNFPNSVISGNFPDSIISGNFPTSGGTPISPTTRHVNFDEEDVGPA